MKNKALMTMIGGLIVAVGFFGIVETAEAEPDGSQRLRGLGDRVFFVNVEVLESGLPPEVLPVGAMFPNCYFFVAGGTWNDPGFPVLGTWMQHSNGAKTSYTASADAGEGFAIVQEGWVTPANGGGILQLVAISTIDLFGLEFLSVGYEVDECPLSPPS